MPQFPLLSSPIKIGTKTMKNRLMSTSMSPGPGYVTEDGLPTQRMLNYLEERSAGGTALICQTIAFFRRENTHGHPLPLGFSDEHIPGLKAMAQVVQKHGGLIVGQPWAVHDWKPTGEEDEKPWGPTDITFSRFPFTAMTKEHIEIFKAQMIQCAVILQKAGWDGVEIMAGVGGIINRFISTATNTRTDEYGGSLENRCRLAVEVMAGIRQACGDDFAMIVRWSPVEFIQGGQEIEDSLKVVPILERAGAQLHNLAIGWHETSVALTTKQVPEGAWSWVSEKIKTVAKIPVATAYRNTDPTSMEDILQRKKADVIAGLRFNIADPEFGKKVMEDRPEDINRCICCCRCIDDVVSEGKPMNFCGVNPHLGEQLDKPLITKTKKVKNVMVIGSGPAGLSAAVTAAKRGHNVTLYERGPRVGGCLVMSAIFSPIYDRLNTYYKTQLQKNSAIKLKLNTTVTAELVEKVKPDAIVVAVGGHAIDLNVPGADGGNVITSHDFLEMFSGYAPQKPGLFNKFMWNSGSKFLKYFYNPGLVRFLMAKSPWPLGKKIAIIGAGLPGCDLALEMMEQNKDIVLIEERKKIGFDIGGSDRFHTTSALKKSPHVRTETLTKVKEINKQGVKVVHADGSEAFHSANSVAVTLGFDKNLTLANSLKNKVKVLYVVGDCDNPARMADATKAGYIAASKI